MYSYKQICVGQGFPVMYPTKRNDRIRRELTAVVILTEMTVPTVRGMNIGINDSENHWYAAMISELKTRHNVFRDVTPCSLN
jgi:hypothetical protein